MQYILIELHDFIFLIVFMANLHDLGMHRFTAKENVRQMTDCVLKFFAFISTLNADEV